MPATITRPTKFTPQRQQSINYTPPGGVFDADTGAPVESFGVGNQWHGLPFGNTPRSGVGKGGPVTWDMPTGQPVGLPNFQNLDSTQPPPVVNPFYTVNPQPQAGTGPFGEVPGVIGMPDPFGNLSGPISNLPQLNDVAASAILSNIRGELSPDTMNAIQDAAARFGISSGMPGSGLSQNRSLRDVGIASEQLRAQGLAQLNPFVSTVSNTQTVRPETQIALAEQNALNAAAPNPQEQSSYSEYLFQKYLDQISKNNPAAGTEDRADVMAARAAVPGSMPSGPFAPYSGATGRASTPFNHTPWDPGSLRNLTWAQREG